MTDYKLYPNLPLAPPENPQVVYHLSIIQAKQRGLKNKEQMFKQKYDKYTKILNQLKCLFEWNKHSHWNIYCRNICYIHRTSCKCGVGCSISDWSNC